jgi:hypothetical protein
MPFLPQNHRRFYTICNRDKPRIMPVLMVRFSHRITNIHKGCVSPPPLCLRTESGRRINQSTESGCRIRLRNTWLGWSPLFAWVQNHGAESIRLRNTWLGWVPPLFACVQNQGAESACIRTQSLSFWTPNPVHHNPKSNFVPHNPKLFSPPKEPNPP